MSKKMLALWGLVAALALLGAGTINNQLRINDANTRLARQAADGARALDRQCRIRPVSKKLYADAFERGVVSADDVALVLDTAAQACGTRP